MPTAQCTEHATDVLYPVCCPVAVQFGKRSIRWARGAWNREQRAAAEDGGGSTQEEYCVTRSIEWFRN
eukprot:gene10216-biopygen1646